MPHALDFFRLQARANRFANIRMAAALRTLTPGAFDAARPSFFGSLHGVLHHALWADRLWLGRLGAVLAQKETENLDDWIRQREACDDALIAFVDRLTPDALDREVAYVTTEGTAWTQALWTILTHLFNHQTHHRGQADDMLAAAGIPDLETDVVLFLRDTGLAKPG